MKRENVLKKIKSFWSFLKKDTWQSILVSLFLAFIFIRFIFFPILSFFTGTSLPLVIVESCSMHHYEKGFEEIFTGGVYSSYGVNINDTDEWSFKNGLNKGDIIFVVGPKNLEVGDVMIFDSLGGAAHPIIHRIISETDGIYTTKGDNRLTNYGIASFEKNIKEDQLIGEAVFRIPLLGWVKLIFFDWKNPSNRRGFC